MKSLTLITLLIILEACDSSEDIDLCHIENDVSWYMKEYGKPKFVFRSKTTRRPIRDEDAEKSVTFYLYTRLNPTEPQILTQDENSLNDSNFDTTSTTVLLIHGWLGNGNNTMNQLLVEAFLKNASQNVIVVDWSYWARSMYVYSMIAVPKMGVEVGSFMEWLTGFGVSYETMHVVGFSLGGHIAGKAGRQTGSRIRRITALDPAGFLLLFCPYRLGKTDAQYVEVIHTNSRMFGLRVPCGDADFYPNGGEIMPSCWLNMCSHSMAYLYMAESVRYNNMNAQSCDQLSNILDDTCAGDTYAMGNADLSKNISGLFRLNIISGRRNYVLRSQRQHSDFYDKERCY